MKVSKRAGKMAQWFWRISGFGFQYPRGNSQSSMILLPGVLVFTSGFYGHQAQINMAHSHVFIQETHTHRIKIYTSLKFYMASKHWGKYRDSLLWWHLDASWAWGSLSFPSGLLQWLLRKESIIIHLEQRKKLISDWPATRNMVTDLKIVNRRQDMMVL